MRIDFLPRHALEDGAPHQFCLHCHAESVEWFTEGGRKRCACAACGRVADRALVLDPAVSWWVEPDGEYWHETAGVFLRDPEGRFLFFQRTAYPFALTVPAGHVERGEEPAAAAARELFEETGVPPPVMRPLERLPIPGDGCRRGADAHVWHPFLAEFDGRAPLRLNSEGESARWLGAREALSHDLTHAVRTLLERLATTLDDG
ncbi:NUDIX hydrolase [Actinosynnema sp. CS-041913]|uniref:NUDIX hydrolase n=1 Tax=Actinosynnema sp. CS-041913 TaxID=3239917 RepID=UPI003D8F557A